MPDPAQLGADIHLPGIATAHSHAFQRALRARTHTPSGDGDFWSWRRLMYDFASKLTPELMYRVSRFAYAELALAGVTAVGEFHYVHHQVDGTPYEDRLELSDAVVRAALDVGLRITLLRVVYQRAGAGRPPEVGQRRFSDDNLDACLLDVDALLKRYRKEPRATVGIAPHSVRAVSREWIREASTFAKTRKLPFHMHVAEQPREVDECRAEYGVGPVQMLSEDQVIDSRFVAVHATHLSAGDAARLAPGKVCICRTTERDLGDGLPNVTDLLSAQVGLCLGVDSHALSCPFEEARAVELDERTRTQRRARIAPAVLQTALTHGGYAAIGLASECDKDRVVLSGENPALVGTSDSSSAAIFAARSSAVKKTEVANSAIVDDGRLPGWGDIRREYLEALAVLLA